MNELEEYLLINNIVNHEYLADNYKQFNYNNYDELILDLDFLLTNIYPTVHIIKLLPKEQRLDQDSFRKELIKKYNKCIISNSIDIECEACHIIPYSICKNFDINNGLLLSSDLHKTFDKYLWSIKPSTVSHVKADSRNNPWVDCTLTIEINKNINDCGKIKIYEGTKVNIKLNNDLYNNLLYHYNLFIAKHITK